MPRPTPSRAAIPTVLALAAALALLVHALPVHSDDTVSARDGDVGSVADGVRKSGGADLLRPGKVENVGDGKTKVGTTLLLPPSGYKFQPFLFKSANEPSLWFNAFPPSLGDNLVEELRGDADGIRFARTFDTPPTTADAFDFGGEGNLAKKGGGGQGVAAAPPPPQKHWAVKEKPADYLRWVPWKAPVGDGQTNPEVIWQLHELTPQITLESHQAGATLAMGAQIKGRVRSFTEIPGAVLVNGQSIATMIEPDDTTANDANQKTGPFYAHFQATLTGSEENTASLNVAYTAKTALGGHLSVPVAWNEARTQGTLMAFQRSADYMADAVARAEQEARLYALDARVSGTAADPSSPGSSGSAPATFTPTEYQTQLEKKEGDFYRFKRAVVFVAHWAGSTEDTDPNTSSTHALSEGLEVVPMPETKAPRLRATAPANLGNAGDRKLMHDELYSLNLAAKRPGDAQIPRAFKADAWTKTGGAAAEHSGGHCLALPALDPGAINDAAGTQVSQVLGTVVYTPANNVPIPGAENSLRPDLTATMKSDLQVTIDVESGDFATHFKLMDDGGQEVPLPIVLRNAEVLAERKWKVAARVVATTPGQARAFAPPVLCATLKMPIQDGKDTTKKQTYAKDRLKFLVRDEEKDTDRDDLVETAADLDSFGSDSGTIAFDPHPARSPAGESWPQVHLPLASTQWDMLNVHAYLSDGAFHLRPNRFWKSPNNPAFWGIWQHYSLHTRVFHPMDPALAGTAAYNFTDKKRLVTVVRPGGNEVTFVFDDQNKPAIGIPIGVNKKRTYILVDRTPADTADLDYEIQFSSGVIHRFKTAPAPSASTGDYTPDDTTRYGVLELVRDSSGRQVAMKPEAVAAWSPLAAVAGSAAAAQTPLAFSAAEVAGPKYAQAVLGYNGGAVGVAKYKDRGSPAEIKVAGQVKPAEASRPFRWVALEKSGVGTVDLKELSCRVEGATITHGAKDAPADQKITVTRSGTTTLTTTLPKVAQGSGTTATAPTTGNGTTARAFTYDANDLLTTVTETASGLSGSSTTNHTYATGTDRYLDNRAPKWASLTRAESKDGANLLSWSEIPERDAKTGWPTRVVSSYLGTLSGSGSEAVLTYGLGDAGVAGEDPYAPASNAKIPYLTESARKTETKLNGASVGISYLQVEKPATGAVYTAETAKESGAAFGSSMGMRTVTTLKPLGPADVSSPAGGATHTSTLTAGGAALSVKTQATGPGGDQVSDTEAQVNAFGFVESAKTTLYADGGSEVVDQLTTQPWTGFGFGRIKKAIPLATPDQSYTEVLENGTTPLRGPGRVRNADGSETAFTYDRLGRVTRSTHYPGGGDHARSLATEAFYDALGRTVWTRTTGTNPDNTLADETSVVTGTATYDLFGRLTKSTDNNGHATTCAHTFAGGVWTATTTYPKGNTAAVATFIDGRTKSVGGTAQVPVTYTHGTVASQGETVSVAYAGLAGDYTKTYANFFGAAFKTERPGPVGLLTEQTEFDDKGRATKVTGMDGIVSEITYNGRGEVSQTTTGGRPVKIARAFTTPAGIPGAPKCHGVTTTVGESGGYSVSSYAGITTPFGGSQFIGGTAKPASFASFNPVGAGGTATCGDTGRTAPDTLTFAKGTLASSASGITGATATHAQSPLLIGNKITAQVGTRQLVASVLHDKVGLPKTATFPDGRTVSTTTRDANDNATAWTRQDGQAINRTLNNREQTTQITGAGEINHGILDTAPNAQARGLQSSLNVPAANAGVTATGGVVTKLDYLPTIALPSQKTIDGTIAVAFEYHANAWPKAITRADARQEFTFNALNGDLTKQSFTASGGTGVAFGYDFGRDTLGRMTSVTGTGAATGTDETFTWNDNQRLGKVDFGHAGASVSYTYDDQGRRTGMTVAGEGWSLGDTCAYAPATGLLSGTASATGGNTALTYEPGLGVPSQIGTTLDGATVTQSWTPEAQTNRTKTLGTTAGNTPLHAIAGVQGAGMWNAMDQRKQVREERFHAGLGRVDASVREAFYDGEPVVFAEAAVPAPVLAAGTPFVRPSFSDDFTAEKPAATALNASWRGVPHHGGAATLAAGATAGRGFMTFGGGVPARALQAVDVPAGLAHDAEASATLTIGNAGDSQALVLRAQWDGNPASAQPWQEEGVEAGLTAGATTFTVRTAAGVVGSANLTLPVLPNEAWRVKLRLTTSSAGTHTLRAKAWRAALPEPAGWSVAVNNATLPRGTGRAGIVARTLANGQFFVDDLRVDNLDAPPGDDFRAANGTQALTKARGWSTTLLHGGKVEHALAATVQSDQAQVTLTPGTPLTETAFPSAVAYDAWVAQGGRSQWLLQKTKQAIATPDAVITTTVTPGEGATPNQVPSTCGLIAAYGEPVAGAAPEAIANENYYHAYAALDATGTPQVRVEKVSAGAVAQTWQGSASFTVGQPLHLRFRTTSAGQLLAKAWPAGTAEPAAWGVDQIDANVPYTSGKCGVSVMRGRGAAAASITLDAYTLQGASSYNTLPTTRLWVAAQTISPKRADIVWTDAVAEAGYRVEYSTDNAVTWQPLTTTGQNATQASDLAVTPGQARRYRVTALDAGNQPLPIQGISGSISPPVLAAPLAVTKDRPAFLRVADENGATRAGECRTLVFDQVGNLRASWQGGTTTTTASNRLNQVTSRASSGQIPVTGEAPADQTILARVSPQSGGSGAWTVATRAGDHYAVVLAADGTLPTSQGRLVDVQIAKAGSNLTGGAQIEIIETKTITVRPRSEQFFYDLRGNLMRDGLRNYTFDLADRLVQATERSGTRNLEQPRQAQFTYDFLGRRLSRTITRGGQTLEYSKFVYDGRLPVAEVDGDNQLVRSYVWKPGAQASGGIGCLQSLTVYKDANGSSLPSPKKFLAASDDQGNVVALVSAATGQPVVTYRYGQYGEILEKSSDGSADGQLALASNKLLWQTKYYEEAVEAYDFGFRWLQVSTGRWMSRDPLAEEGGLNLYGYCDGDASNRHDAWGLDYLDDSQGEGGMAYWVVEEDGYTVNSDRFRIPLGAIHGGDIHLMKSAGGGSVSRAAARDLADKFWREYSDDADQGYAHHAQRLFGNQNDANYSPTSHGALSRLRVGRAITAPSMAADQAAHMWMAYKAASDVESHALTFGLIGNSAAAYKGSGIPGLQVTEVSATVARESLIGAATLGAGTMARGSVGAVQVAAKAAQATGAGYISAQGVKSAYEGGHMASEGVIEGDWTKATLGTVQGTFGVLSAGGGAAMSPVGKMNVWGGAAKSVAADTTSAYRTWNQFQKGTAGQFASRAEAAKGWTAYKQANGIMSAAPRSMAARSEYLRSLADDWRTPTWQRPWLKEGRVPPGYEVDHIRPLSVGGADAPTNMRLQSAELHEIHHRYFRPWEW